MDEVTRHVRNMYTRYPFPSNDRIENELPSWLPRPLKRLLNRSRKHRSRLADIVAEHLRAGPRPWRYLDAGCGTGETLARVAAEIPEAEVHAFDLSSVSIEKARRLLAREQLEVASLREHDLMDPLPFPIDHFSVITSLGVVHHLSDPVKGLRNLARCLRPDGALVLYLYGRFGRQREIWIREALPALAGPGADFAEKIRIVETLDLYPRRRRSRTKERLYRALGFDRARSRRVWIVDQLAHVSEREYTVAEIRTDLEAAGLRLERFHGFPNQLSELTRDEAILARARGLPPEEQWRVIELLLQPSGYVLSARRIEATPA